MGEYRSRNYRPEDVVSRYVSFLGGRKYRVYEVAANTRTIREYDTDGADLPADKLAEARGRHGYFPSTVLL